MIPLKTAAIEDALDRATIRLGIYTLIYTSFFTINGRKQVIIIVIIITVKQLN